MILLKVLWTEQSHIIFNKKRFVIFSYLNQFPKKFIIYI